MMEMKEKRISEKTGRQDEKAKLVDRGRGREV
jgi:hypothetical protein